MKLRCETCRDLVEVTPSGDCVVCGSAVALAMPDAKPLLSAVPDVGTAPAVGAAPAGPVGVGGWLLFFVICAGLVTPGVAVASIVGELQRGWDGANKLAIVLYGAFGISSAVIALAMAKGSRAGLQAAKVLVAVSVVAAALRSDDLFEVMRRVSGPVAWLLYLHFSRRVRNTYGVDRPRPGTRTDAARQAPSARSSS